MKDELDKTKEEDIESLLTDEYVEEKKEEKIENEKVEEKEKKTKKKRKSKKTKEENEQNPQQEKSKKIAIIIILILLALIIVGTITFLILGKQNLKISKSHIKEPIEVAANKEYNNNEFKYTTPECTFFSKKVKIERLNDIDLSKLGEQEIEYKCDKLMFSKSIKIKYLIEDKELPELTITDKKEMSLYVGDKYEEKGATATDNYDGDLTDKIEIEGNVDTSKEGTYKLTYKVKDSSGNETSDTRTVKVTKVSTPTPGNSTCGVAGTIYLTFDDGPNSYYTPVILDVLKKYNVKATFFVTSAGPDSMIKREYDEGHAIALHSSTHDYAKIYSSSEGFWKDMNVVSDRVERITGEKTYLLRFPGGASNTVSRKYKTGIMAQLTREVEAKGYAYFDWNISSGDAGGTTDPNVEYKNVVNYLSKSRGNVVLMHDIKKHTSEAIERIVKYGIDNGYKFDVLTKDVVCHQRTNN